MKKKIPGNQLEAIRFTEEQMEKINELILEQEKRLHMSISKTSFVRMLVQRGIEVFISEK